MLLYLRLGPDYIRVSLHSNGVFLRIVRIGQQQKGLAIIMFRIKIKVSSAVEQAMTLMKNLWWGILFYFALTL